MEKSAEAASFDIEQEAEKERHFSVMFVNAPHVTRSEGFQLPPEPTSLLGATSVLDHYVRTDTFPALKTPEILSVENPIAWSPEYIEKFIQEIKEKQPRVVGISNTSVGHYVALEMAQIVEMYSPQTLVIFGGSHEDGTNFASYFQPNSIETAHITDNQRERLKLAHTLSDKRAQKSVDIVVSGDGPYALVELLKMVGNSGTADNNEILSSLVAQPDIFRQVEGSGNVYVYDRKEETIVCLPLSGLPLDWNRIPFDVQLSNKGAQEYLETYRQGIQEDFYFGPEYEEYLNGQKKGLHLNHASLTRPCVLAETAAEEVFRKALDQKEKDAIFEKARQNAATLMDVNEQNVAFGRNTTEALSYCFWLAGLEAGDRVLLTDAENRSIARLFEVHMDHSNPTRDDPWSTFPTYYQKRQRGYGDVTPALTGVSTTSIEAVRAFDEEIFAEIEQLLTPDTKCFVISHVVRDTGRTLPIREICDFVRKKKQEINPQNPDIFIAIDGAQAIGNLPKINFSEIGCDAYVGTPHKTMASTPLGLLYFDSENSKIQKKLKTLNTLRCQDEQILLRGAFHPDLGVKPNVDDEIETADVAGFNAAIGFLGKMGYKDGDFSEINEQRSQLKEYFMTKLHGVAYDLDLEVYEAQANTEFISGFSIPGINNRELARRLSQRGVFVSYIDRAKIQVGEGAAEGNGIVRVSFSLTNYEGEIDEFMPDFEEVLRELKSEAVSSFEEVADEVLLEPNMRPGFLGWVAEQITSPIGKIATTAVSIFLVVQTLKYEQDTKWGRIPLDQTFLQAQAEEAEVKERVVRSWEQQYNEATPEKRNGLFGFRYINSKPIEEGLWAKHMFLANLNNPAAIDDLFGDESDMQRWNIVHAPYTQKEREVIKTAYRFTRDERIGEVVREIEDDEKRGMRAIDVKDEWFVAHMQEKIDEYRRQLEYYRRLESEFPKSDASPARWRVLEEIGSMEISLAKYTLLASIYDPKKINQALDDGALYFLHTYDYTPEEHRHIMQAHRSHGALTSVVSAMTIRAQRSKTGGFL